MMSYPETEATSDPSETPDPAAPVQPTAPDPSAPDPSVPREEPSGPSKDEGDDDKGKRKSKDESADDED
jgi:hypothetical protein